MLVKDDRRKFTSELNTQLTGYESEVLVVAVLLVSPPYPKAVFEFPREPPIFLQLAVILAGLFSYNANTFLTNGNQSSVFDLYNLNFLFMLGV